MKISGDGFFRPLWTGGAYLLLLIVVGQAIWHVRRWLEDKATPLALRLRFWGGWSYWGSIAGVVFTLVYLFVGLLDGTFAASDVGLSAPEVTKEGGWLLVLGLALVGWMTLLWGVYWRQYPPGEGNGARQPPTWGRLALQIPFHEGRMAIMRAALIPVLGVYWGSWAAVICVWLASYLDPACRTKLRTPSPRAIIYLGWAMDWLSGLFYVLSGSLWATLLARVLAYLPLRALSAWPGRPRRRARLLQGQGQNNEQGEHGNSGGGKAP